MFKKSIESILSDISIKVGKLRALAEIHAAEAEYNKVQADIHNEAVLVKTKLRDRATRVAEKFEELLK